MSNFRDEIEAHTYRSQLKRSSKPLYDWLIHPFEKELLGHNIESLVFVPDGVLGNLPMSALHDGHQYLIEKYSIAITTNLMLTDPKPLRKQHHRVLLAGISEAVNSMPALEAIPRELRAIHGIFDGDILLDDDFTSSTFTEKVKNTNYSIIHIASHAQFTGDSQSSFIQAYDQPIRMNDLTSVLGTTKYRNKPLEMLVLSACLTARGDAAATLGLAGASIRAGARSAMGSLWNIDDAATAELIEIFYAQLKKENNSKAEALRQAQLSLLKTERYGHPANWSAFTIIGNWL